MLEIILAPIFRTFLKQKIMEKEDKIKMFQSELNLIYDENIREQVRNGIAQVENF